MKTLKEGDRVRIYGQDWDVQQHDRSDGSVLIDWCSADCRTGTIVEQEGDAAYWVRADPPAYGIMRFYGNALEKL
jgi:hypothetical protein